MSELRFLVPGPDEPGFLKREQARLIFLEKYLEVKKAKDKLPFLIDYLVQFVTEPEDKKKAKELLWDAPESIIAELRQYFVLGLFPGDEAETEDEPGSGVDDVPDPEKEGSGAG